MRTIVIASATMLVLAGVPAANAQAEGPTYSSTIHQSAGDRDSRGTPKYYEPAPGARHKTARRSWHAHRTTTGAGAGPYYSDTIHQSAGDRDSRGTPKYYHPGY
ncbi:MAG TPA: hypothetical protein VLX44_22525 [Xanthobacteraceae bacterium]|nr:hypothetical protein [Xanthobacteraceae bacterium]